jgi:S1-C subfamily serine protease
VVTSGHVVEKARAIQVVMRGGISLPATVVAEDKKTDLAILKIDVTDHACLPISSSRAVKLGTTVATVGFPNPGIQGIAPKLAKGEIAALSGILDDPNCFQISVPLQPGNSGGGVFDAQGNVVGVASAMLDQRAMIAATGSLPNNVAYAVKSSLLLNLVESVPGLIDQLHEPQAQSHPFEDVVSAAERATVLIKVQ